MRDNQAHYCHVPGPLAAGCAGTRSPEGHFNGDFVGKEVASCPSPYLRAGKLPGCTCSRALPALEDPPPDRLGAERAVILEENHLEEFPHTREVSGLKSGTGLPSKTAA